MNRMYLTPSHFFSSFLAKIINNTSPNSLTLMPFLFSHLLKPNFQNTAGNSGDTQQIKHTCYRGGSVIFQIGNKCMKGHRATRTKRTGEEITADERCQQNLCPRESRRVNSNLFSRPEKKEKRDPWA